MTFKIMSSYRDVGKRGDRGIIIDVVSNENEKPYVFRVGDQFKAKDDGTLERTFNGYPIRKVDIEHDLEWLNKKLNELNNVLQRKLRECEHIPQSDVHEYNFIRELLEELNKELKNDRD